MRGKAMNEFERSQLLRHVQICKFELVDSSLYLDSHPDCPEAVEYYKEHLDHYHKAVAAYEEHCGPINHKSAVKNGRWTWNDAPWPWEIYR
jgi:spore coat protein JB